jgi:hypothetical protein
MNSSDFGSSNICSDLKHGAKILQRFHDRIATGVITVFCTAALLRCGKQTAKLPQYYFSWIVCFHKETNRRGLKFEHCGNDIINMWKVLKCDSGKYGEDQLDGACEKRVLRKGIL